MKITIVNSKLLRRTEEGYREYGMELKEWSEFFGQEYFPVIIADESVDFTEEKYKMTYQYLQENRESILDVLVEYSLKEYNYSREFCFLDASKRNFEHVARHNPKIEGRENAKGFFQLKKIYISFGGLKMKKYEYKFVKQDIKLGYAQNKKIEDAEKEWNTLGNEGWQFCKEGAGVIIFMREVNE